MSKSPGNLALAGAVLLFLLIVGGIVAWNVSIWHECRSDHSFGYCMRVVWG